MNYVNSMTAFASAMVDCGTFNLSWEVRSVNHRYLETQFRLPENLRQIEPSLREQARKHLKRGKVDATLRLESIGEGQDLQLDQNLVTQLIRAAEQLRETTSMVTTFDVMEILRWPGVMRKHDVQVTELTVAAADLFRQAIDDLATMRGREGADIAEVMSTQLSELEAQLATLTPLADGLAAQQQARLKERAAQLQVEIDPERLEQEVALLAQKADVREELDRLAIHTKEARILLGSPGPHGRKLDFLIQELNREANTLGSKATSIETSQRAIDLKVIIEQLREQVQNLE